MEKIKRLVIEEYRYDSEEERECHVKFMKSNGYEVGSQMRKSDDGFWKEDREYYWFGEFSKYE